MKAFLLIILISFALSQDSCKKENCVCGVENPQENLPWLNDQLKFSCFEVYSFVFEKKEYIGIQDCEHIADGMTTIYDCQGNKTFDFGGMYPAPTNYGMPYSFTRDFYEGHKKLIYINPK